MGGSRVRLRKVNRPKESLVSAKIPLTPEVQQVLASLAKKRAIPRKHLVSRIMTWFADKPYNFQAAILGQLDPPTTKAIFDEVDRAAEHGMERMQRDRKQAPPRRFNSSNKTESSAES